MDAKSRYRLQLKLQAALTRVGEVLAQFQKEGLKPNGRTALMAAGVQDALAPIAQKLGNHVPQVDDIHPPIVEYMVAAIKARWKETERRGERQRRQEERLAKFISTRLNRKGPPASDP
jgi:hypothetical protein